jgi:hypothetical protein
MTKEEKILALEERYRNIFKRESIPLYLIIKANEILKEWKELTEWKEATSCPVISVEYSTNILDEILHYQKKEQEIFILIQKND